MPLPIQVDDPKVYHTLSEIVDILLDEKKHPCTRLIQPPLLTTQILPIITRSRLNLMISWKKYTDGVIDTNEISGEILVYAGTILSIGTSIREGKYTSCAFVNDPKVDTELVSISNQISDGIKAASISPIFANVVKLWQPHLFFGDAWNVEGLKLTWREDDKVYAKKLHLNVPNTTKRIEGSK